jgi:hypothetical protein
MNSCGLWWVISAHCELTYRIDGSQAKSFDNAYQNIRLSIASGRDAPRSHETLSQDETAEYWDLTDIVVWTQAESISICIVQGDYISDVVAPKSTFQTFSWKDK